MSPTIRTVRDAHLLVFDPDTQKRLVAQHLPAINRYANAELSADDVLVMGMYLCNTARDFYYSRFSRKALDEVAELTPGRPVQASHTYGLGMLGLPLARYFDADVVQLEKRGWSKKDSHWTKCLYYTVNDEEGQRIYNRVRTGVWKEVSIGWRCADATCSICNESILSCGHEPGEVYERGGMCEYEFNGITGVLEGSFVFAGGQKDTSTFIPGERGARPVVSADGLLWSEMGAYKQALRTYARANGPGIQPWARTPTDDVVRILRAEPGMRRELFALELTKERYPDTADAKRWVRDNDFRADRMEESDAARRFVQFDASASAEVTVKTVRVDDGVSGLYLRAKTKRDAARSVEELLKK